ncbi:MAG: hypothetical protein AAFY07_03395 [Pseudomonadota bacterium]
MKRVQTVGLIMAPLALMACQGETSDAPAVGGENGTEEAVTTLATNAPDGADNPDSADNNVEVEAATADPSTPNAAEAAAAAQSASNNPDPETTPARSKLQRAD